jgi:hypothetical protein
MTGRLFFESVTIAAPIEPLPISKMATVFSSDEPKSGDIESLYQFLRKTAVYKKEPVKVH